MQQSYSFSVTVILRASPPSEEITISPVARLRMLLNLSPHSTTTSASGVSRSSRPERLKLALAFEAIDVEVEELDGLAVARAVELVNEREGGTGDLVGLGGVERLCNAFHERGFSRAQIAAKEQQLRRLEQIGELTAHCNSVGAALRGELEYSALRDWSGFGHCQASQGPAGVFVGAAPCNQT